MQNDSRFELIADYIFNLVLVYNSFFQPVLKAMIAWITSALDEQTFYEIWNNLVI